MAVEVDKPIHISIANPAVAAIIGSMTFGIISITKNDHFYLYPSCSKHDLFRCNSATSFAMAIGKNGHHKGV